MGKLAKIFLLLIVLIAIAFPPVAVKVRDIMKKQGEEIAGLETDVAETEGKLRITEEEKKAIEGELDTEKRERAKVERELDLTKQKLSSVQDEIGRKEAELNKCVIEKRELEEDMKQFTDGEAGLAEKVAELTKELDNLKLGIVAYEDVTPDQGEDLPERGRIAGVYGNRFVTISLNSKIGDVTSPTFVYRRGKVLGKVTLNKVHSATVVIEAQESELLKNISEGDVVELEGEETLLRPELFEGRVATASRHDFVSIEVATPAHMIRQPSFVIYKGNDAVGTIKSTRILSFVIVAELGGVKRGMRIAPKDYLRTPR